MNIDNCIPPAADTRLPASRTATISNIIINSRVTRSKNSKSKVTKQWTIYLIFANLDDSPELLAPFVLPTDFLWDGVEWWLWLWVSGLEATNISTDTIVPRSTLTRAGTFYYQLVTVLHCFSKTTKIYGITRRKYVWNLIVFNKRWSISTPISIS